MKNLNADAMLTSRDVPPELDVRILAAARSAAEKRRRDRRIRPWFWSAAAAAAGMLIAAGVFLHAPVLPRQSVTVGGRAKGAMPESELLALSDWSEFEQHGYVLMKSVGSCSQDLADWNSESLLEM